MDSSHAGSLYISHFISTWNSRGFEFGAVLFLATIYPGTLQPLSIYALVRAFATIVLAPAVGKFIDRENRLRVVRLSIVGQRVAVALSCIIFLALLKFKSSMSSLLNGTLFACTIALACVEKLSATMNTISVERDWAVVIAGDDDSLLRRINSQMRGIDLFCKLVSPLLIALLDGFSSFIAIVVTLAVNGTSVFAEYFLIARVYRKIPSLEHHELNRIDSSTSVSGTNFITASRSLVRSLSKQLAAYVKSHAFLPSLALSLLYMTVLSFAGQMVTYLLAVPDVRLTSTHIGLLRTVATVVEISSTFVAPLLMTRLGAVRTGIWSLSWQFLVLVPGIATFWLPSYIGVSPVLKVSIFVTSVVLSRVGLWCFDLTAQLLIQNSVSSQERGQFSSTEASLQNFFELCTFAVTIIWSKPQDFKWPATISLGAMFAAMTVYARFVRLERGHLLHCPGCLSVHGAKHSTAYERITAEEEVQEEEVGLERQRQP